MSKARRIFVWRTSERPGSWADDPLRAKAAAVDVITDDHRAVISDMWATLAAARGMGLAATQIGVPIRVVVIDLDPTGQGAKDPRIASVLSRSNYHGPVALVNPRIVRLEGTQISDEGCLSVPGVTAKLPRAERVVVRALDEHGEATEIEASGVYAAALQHEVDHLDGILFVDYLSKLKRDMAKKKVDKFRKRAHRRAS